jgi:hypothetical protein
VLFYQKQIPAKKSNTITYVCPKPTERDTFSDSLILDALDFSYIPRFEAEKKDSIIWKTASTRKLVHKCTSASRAVRILLHKR